MIYAVNRDLSIVTQQILDNVYMEYKEKHTIVDLIDRDPDLVISNDNPTGDYHLTYQFTEKCEGFTGRDGIFYPYIPGSLDIYSFNESIKHKVITEYPCEFETIWYYIKIEPGSVFDKSKDVRKPKPRKQTIPDDNRPIGSEAKKDLGENSTRPRPVTQLVIGSSEDLRVIVDGVQVVPVAVVPAHTDESLGATPNSIYINCITPGYLAYLHIDASSTVQEGNIRVSYWDPYDTNLDLQI
jgi:hypothetical protein